MEWMDSLCLYGMIRAEKAKEELKNGAREFFTSQDGVSNVVATIIILLIVVLLIGAFWSQLKTWVQGLMDQIFGSNFDSSGLEGGN